jgi:hypothetical protein
VWRIAVLKTHVRHTIHQGCQMVCFQTKNPDLGKFWRVLQWKIFFEHWVYLMAIGNILWTFGIFCGHLVYFAPFWYFVPRKICHPCYTRQVSYLMRSICLLN